jgi:CBS-domain-containing membrane protein
MREYSPLPLALLAPGARVTEPAAPGHVTLDDPAFAVMTDLQEVHAACTSPEELVDRAQARMVERGVRLLFVLDDDASIVGLITTTDLLGEKPMRVTAARGVTHAELIVADLMTPAARLDSLTFQDVSQMRVGHIVATLKAIRRQHLLVSEADGKRVRGIFSATQLARQLGMPLQTFEVAQTFADIEAALVRT